MIYITTFNSEYSPNKKPVSPYEDYKSFDFDTQLYDLRDVHLVFAKHFVLSNPISSVTKIKRDDENLKPLALTKNNNYVVLDFDKVKTKEDSERIIEFFKSNGYSVNIFKSKSYEKKGYNLKAVMLISNKLDVNTKIKEAVINYLNSVLYLFCEVDVSACRISSYQAPTYNTGCLYYNRGKDFFVHDLDSYLNEIAGDFEMQLPSDVSGWFYNHLLTKHGATFKSSNKDTYSVALPIEEKSKFGYFWNRNRPQVLLHPQKTKSINMMGDFLKSVDGKKYIKELNNKLLEESFDVIPHESINARHFELNDALKRRIDTFKDVLVIKGIMGSGKSTLIEYFLKDKPRVLLLTMRRSLALDMSKKYGIKNYIEDLNNGTKTQYVVGDSLVVQIDSLFKINTNDFDYCVIDEFESLCVYTQNNLKNSNYYVKNIKNLYNLFSKRVVIADAFINNTSINLHFQGRKTETIINRYKDTCSVFVYEHKQTFITFLEQYSIRKKEDEFITCSFGTLSELHTVQRLLQEHGLKVITLTSDTTHEAKEVMYKLFEEKHHNKYDVVLFSPTITVGVSILNNVKHHFHFDSGKSIDPLSSIQMLKRSRLSENIHVFIKGRFVNYKSYDVDFINTVVAQNIKDYLNDSKNIVFYNVDTDKLSDLGKFVNTFVAHNNYYTNDHESMFKFLLTQQFENIKVITENIPHSKFDRYNKEQNSNKIIEFETVTHNYCVEDIDYLSSKNRTQEENNELIFLKTKKAFFHLDDEKILDIAKSYNADKYYVDKLKSFVIYIKKQGELDDLISDYALSNISKMFSVDNSDDGIKLLKFMQKIKGTILQDSYSSNELKALDLKYGKGVNFSWFLKKLGYSRINKGMKLSSIYKKHLSWIL